MTERTNFEPGWYNFGMYYNCETQTEGIMSRFLQERRMQTALPYIQRKVLDFGFGNGSLAGYLDKSQYTGIDINPEAVRVAQQRFPDYCFFQNSDFVAVPDTFNCIAMLAVIEHLQEPLEWLAWLNPQLETTGRLVITTPHPHYRKVHEVGATFRIFSRSAAQDHEVLIDDSTIRDFASNTGFRLLESSCFLFGANQLFVLEKLHQLSSIVRPVL